MTTQCKICNGAEQNIIYGGDEPSDPLDCVCTDQRWDSENQDKCLECDGTGSNYSYQSGKKSGEDHSFDLSFMFTISLYV